VLDAIDHVGIAVAELEPALVLWREGMGLEVSHREVVQEQGVEAVLLDVGDSHVELLAPLGPDTPVGKFLAKRGPGLHHVAYRVADAEAALAELAHAGFELIDRAPRVGIGGARVAFLEPKSTGRVLVEIVEPR
jgi:methylmalonyl-CoA/ethylmalonyl-CoA epimerase